MHNEITNKVLLEHIQAMKNDLQSQIGDLHNQTRSLRDEMRTGFANVDRRFEDVYHKLDEAREHREALQEDLIATMRTVAKHDKKFARLKR